MGTEILLPQDCLIQQTGASPAAFYRRKYSSGNFKSDFNKSSCRSYRKPTGRFDRPDQRKRVVSSRSEPPSLKRSSSDDGKMVNSLVMEKVTIFRRGQSLDSFITSEQPKKEGVNTETVPEQILVLDQNTPLAVKRDIYAGSAFFMSPPPSSLPLPSFYKKKQVLVTSDDWATRDLRRLLRLDV